MVYGEMGLWDGRDELEKAEDRDNWQSTIAVCPTGDGGDYSYM